MQLRKHKKKNKKQNTLCTPTEIHANFLQKFFVQHKKKKLKLLEAVEEITIEIIEKASCKLTFSYAACCYSFFRAAAVSGGLQKKKKNWIIIKNMGKTLSGWEQKKGDRESNMSVQIIMEDI